jgi:Bacterial Ig-like domain (group 2)
MTGTVTITATDPTTMIQGMTTLTVAPVLRSIAISDVNGNTTGASISVGSTDQLIATGTFSDDSMANISNSVIWACAPAGVATVSSTGLAYGQAASTCNVTATSGAVTSSNTFTLTVTAPQLCTNSGVPYLGAQAGAGDRFDACIAHSDSTFSLLDLSTKAVAVTGTFTTNATYANLLTLNSTTPAVGSGTAVEMPSTALLINPGLPPTGLKTRTFNPLPNPIALVFQQQPGVCPATGETLLFVTLPQTTWTASNVAYGTVALGSSTLTIDGSLLNGTTITQTDGYTCDTTTSLLSFTDASAAARLIAVSPSGLVVGNGINGLAGLPQPAADVTITSGDTFLGVMYEPNPRSNLATTVGFTATSSTSLSGFDPLATGNPSNGVAINLGAQSSPGLFTGGILTDGADTDPNFAAIAHIVGGKKVLYGITFDTTKNTPVSVLLLQP